jgi:PD-(D/E)XK nuclease superfamily
MADEGSVGQEDGKTGRFEDVSQAVIGACIEVHRHLGPGLLESAYEHCVAHELACVGLRYERQRPVPLEYKGTKLDCGYRLDLVVEGESVLKDGLRRLTLSPTFPSSRLPVDPSRF